MIRPENRDLIGRMRNQINNKNHVPNKKREYVAIA